VRLRLTKKLAEEIDGVDLHGHEVGDVVDLPPQEATLLMAEQWAFPERRRDRPLSSSSEYGRRADDCRGHD
jgi:hypothetical protein